LKTVGVLALQGAFAKHIAMVKSLGVHAIEVRTVGDLVLCAGLIIPGGESTTMRKQIAFSGLWDPLLAFAANRPLFGTCAGLILMARQIIGSAQSSMGLLDVVVERNGFGRQIDSFSTSLQVKVADNSVSKPCDAFFIRAPKIVSCGPEVHVLATHEGSPVLVQQGRHLGAAFHPELTQDPSIHRYFLSMIMI
jgi:pyridoxal 5'-phosphate synthase pdxT subunit